MTSLPPRVVFVVRETDFELLVARHATREQSRFFLESRGQNLAMVEAMHEQFLGVLRAARSQVPEDWRQTVVRRSALDRFLFAHDDIVVAIGQDGLVANVAKYLDGQPVIGVNSAPDRFDGVLMHVRLDALASFLFRVWHGDCAAELRTMAEVRLDSGQHLLALNEIFVGHRSHQSARYVIRANGIDENQSSSGLIVSTGTGATGWARSISQASGIKLRLAIDEAALAFMVREPFPSVSTGTSIRSGKIGSQGLSITSRMNEGGIVFADGIEQDFLAFDWGRELTVLVSSRRLHLIRE